MTARGTTTTGSSPSPGPTRPQRTAGADRSRSAFIWMWEWTKSIVVALVVWFFLRTFLVEAFRIPSGSMENTLLIGDFLFVNKALYGAEVPLIHTRLPAVREPQRNDILVFDSVEEEGLKVVKRLIGMPGDTLAWRAASCSGTAQRVNEPYARALAIPPLRGPDPARQDARVAGAASGAAGHGHLPAGSAGLGADRGAAPIRSS